MEVIEQVVLPVQEPTQAGDARRRATAIAERIGFDVAGAGRVAVVVTEVATNLAKHARGGELLVRGVRDGAATGVLVLAVDRGPGIANVAAALADGFSTSTTPGTGLGAIARLSTVFDVYSGPAGTVLVARLTLDARPSRSREAGRVEFAGLSVPVAGEAECGDAWAAARDDRGGTVLVVDGLGHGRDAAEAARAAVAAFGRHAATAPAEILDRIHDALRASRGAAAAVADVDCQRGIVRFAGIGNVTGLVVSSAGTRGMVSCYGTLGHQMRRIQEFTYPIPPGALVVLHSDGLGSRWDLDAYPGLAARHPMLTAGVLYRDFRRVRDDTTVVVVREAA